MRYAQDGGLTGERRFSHEKLRLEAAERFRHGDESTVIAHDLGQRPVRAALAQSLVIERAESPGLEEPGLAARC
ncbi:hypothetical protein [Streptomyces sp. KHY 26]|uniref:hypothetical protein n=1 Tax=Streptomyces sp. KHY 26 TaxID=3097359 RepID=UPI00376EB60D